MSFAGAKEGFSDELDEIKDSSLWKTKRVITSEQKK